MAWIYKRSDSELWWIGTRANGKQILKSTGERDEAKAKAQLATLESMEAAQRAGRLHREFFEALTGAHIEVVHLFESLDVWIKETIQPATRKNYANFAKQFKAAMPHNPALIDITHEQVRMFLAGIRAEKRASTADLARKCAAAFFARFSGAVRKDPTEGIPAFKRDGTEIDREAFTPEQIRSVVSIASPFWRCAVAVAFYSGLRISNVASLKVGQINFKAGNVEVARTVKTGKSVCVKLPTQVLAMIYEEIKKGSAAADYVWPTQAKMVVDGNATILSGQFGELLVKAGLREPGSRSAPGRRTVNALTFHSLRHAFISALANAGVNQQVVKQLVGHASDRVNDAYTHIGQQTLDRAAALLPDITKAEVTK